MEFFGCVFCGPPSSCVLSLTPSTAVINGRTRGFHQAVLWENSTKTQCSQARLQSSQQLLALISFYRLIFLPPFSASGPCLLSHFTLAPSVSADGTLGRRSAHTPPPRPLSLHVRPWSSASPQQRWVFSLSSDGRIASAVFTQGHSHRIARSMTWRLSPAGAPCNDHIPQLILAQFDLSPSF